MLKFLIILFKSIVLIIPQTPKHDSNSHHRLSWLLHSNKNCCVWIDHFLKISQEIFLHEQFVWEQWYSTFFCKKAKIFLLWHSHISRDWRYFRATTNCNYGLNNCAGANDGYGLRNLCYLIANLQNVMRWSSCVVESLI